MVSSASLSRKGVQPARFGGFRYLPGGGQHQLPA